MRLVVFFCMFCCCAFVRAEEPKPKSVQEQIDDLRKGQQQISKQLEEIRTLLKEQHAALDAKHSAPSFLSIDVHGEPFLGDAKARIAVLEYSDFDCGFCAEFATQIFPQINTNYVKTGKVKFFFRDMPSPEHSNAMMKADIARCAGEQGKFWAMHEYLFAHQQPLSETTAEKLAQAVGADTAKLSACLAADKYTPIIQRSLASAERLQINGTPAFIIGTLSEDGAFLKAPRVVLGTQSYEFFQKTLDELLPGASPTPPPSP
jgi:protein-disulfide isomerase